ncbi:PilZ domain-containing protein [Fusibacter bizertensis]|jgi:PilZ domain.|uniref:PilZ domain-containing protein n=1 Tax=Fusibacter bizertensis TaxID=1488331 RepID=A0ABT6NEU7_9FIRM|nr:PilZ domain-containing protein [Fusibacter bizertensis]MDH8678895.1 PilZ domain-containing protein [Fusibacter bizertensis]
MRERRRSHRVTYNAVINIDQVYNQEQIIKGTREFPVEILDISKGGIGFIAKEELPINFYFNAKIDLGNGKQFYSVLKIMRVEEIEEGYNYGCEFTGLADILSLYIDEFEQEKSI